jgi:hypothetical protein
VKQENELPLLNLSLFTHSTLTSHRRVRREHAHERKQRWPISLQRCSPKTRSGGFAEGKKYALLLVRIKPRSLRRPAIASHYNELRTLALLSFNNYIICFLKKDLLKYRYKRICMPECIT